MAITISMLPDVLACAALSMLAIYHLMIYWGRKKDAAEVYNIYFSAFVLSATLFIIAPYFQPQYFLFALKPSWLYVLNIEAFMSLCLFLSGIKFFNSLLTVPQKVRRYFKFTYYSIPLNCILTLTANFIGPQFYFKNVLPVVLLISASNLILIFTVYGMWLYREKLYKENFYRIVYLGFLGLTLNIFIYRAIELLRNHDILVVNHYISVFILYVFAYALSVKFNTEYFELKDLKISLEKKVTERTLALERSNQLLENQNLEIEKQKLEIVVINAELSKRATELLDLNQARSRFFAGISHEFRTPLTLIIGPLEMLLTKNADAKTTGDYTLMLRQAKRLLELINQLLELSKLQKGVLSVNLVHGNFSQFVQSLISSYEVRAIELGIQLTFINECRELNTAFDPDKTEKIVTNLLTNALKFTKKDGRVEIITSLSADEQLIEVAVRDNGIGIAEEELKYIFDPFYQGNSDHAGEGTGIGLSLVKELVELLNGSIELKSLLHHGTEVIVTIPLIQSSSSAPGAATKNEIEFELDNHPDELLNTQNKSVEEKIIILLVEDNGDMRDFIKTNLPSHYRVAEAFNGQEGFEMAETLLPDLIIADVMMPLVNGIQMTRKLKQDERTSHIPVIMLTAKASIESKLEGLETQADDYITKPFNIQELALRIKNLLLNRQKLREKFSRCITVNPSDLVTTSVDEKFLQKALQVVEKNIEETDFSAEQFASEISVSRAHIHRKLKALTGQSATEFIRAIRLKRAAQLLSQNAGSVSEIAYQSGFNNLSYFTKCFKEAYGTLPSTYFESLENHNKQ
jgi:signal transduction histidine kinase/DNA-binding response OmpR family regulator